MNTRVLTLILAGLSMVGPFAIDTFLPSFPAIARQMSIDMATMQQALSAYLLAFAGMSLFYGTLSDAFGRRRVILASLLLFSLASLGAALSPGFGWLLAFRIAQGLSAGGGMVVGMALVRDRFTGATAQRVLSQILMIFGIAPAIAPVLGGWLQVHYGWRAVFLFLTGLGLLLWLASWMWLDESLPRDSRLDFHPLKLLRSYGAALTNARFLAQSLGFAFAFGGLALYIASSASFVMDILHLPATSFGALFLPMVGGMVAGSAIASRLSHVLSPTRLLWIAFGTMAAGTVANLAYTATFTAVLPWAVVPIMVYATGLGIGMPAMSLLSLELLPATRGLAASIYNFAQMLVFAAVSSVLAPMLFHSASRLAEGLLLCFGSSCVCWAVGQVVRRPRMHPQTS